MLANLVFWPRLAVKLAALGVLICLTYAFAFSGFMELTRQWTWLENNLAAPLREQLDAGSDANHRGTLNPELVSMFILVGGGFTMAIILALIPADARDRIAQWRRARRPART